MLRTLFLLLLLFASGEIFGQGVTVKKSTDIVVIKGRSYYLHVVDEGETLYSICKAYGVEVEDIKKINDKQGNDLSLFEVLKVPYVEPYVEKDKNYYYHKVQKGETLYSIARKFDIKVKRILKENPEYDRKPLPLDAVLRLPLREIDTSRIGRISSSPVEVASTTIIQETEKDRKDTLILEEGNQKDVVFMETLSRFPLKPDSIPAFITDDPSIPDNKYVKVAVLLPLYVRENMDANRALLVVDTMNPEKNVSGRIVHKSEQFVYFYEGLLLAVDSLKAAGYKVNMRVFDTEKNSIKMYEITEELNRFNPDLIIGPVYGSEFRIVAENLANKTIPMVYPLSSRSEDFSKYPNFLQVNVSSPSLIEKMTDWISEQRGTANIISIIGEEEETQRMAETTEKKLFAQRLQEIPEISFYRWNFQEDHMEALKLILQEDKENLIVLPTSREADVSKVLPVLSALTDLYKITVVGFPDWQNFISVDHETFYKLNVKIFTYNFVSSYEEKTKCFSDLFRKYFHADPTGLAYKAYDIGLYFIPLAAKYGERTLEALNYIGREGVFSVFHFVPLCAGCGMENRGLYLVNYSSDYEIKVIPLE